MTKPGTKPGGQNRGTKPGTKPGTDKTGDDKTKPGTDGTFPSFLGLRSQGEAIPPGISCGLFGPPSLSRSERPQSLLFELSNELGCSQWPTRMRTLAQRAHIAWRFSSGKILLPLCYRPSLLPSFHFEHSVWSFRHAVSRSARPMPLLCRRYHTRTHRIQLHITQRSPQMRIIQWT